MSNHDLIQSLQAAHAASPGDTVLALHLAEMLIAAGRPDEAIPLIGSVLASTPDSGSAKSLMAAALGAGTPTPEPAATSSDSDFDWDAVEAEMDGVVAPMFVDGGGAVEAPAWEIERCDLTLDDVGGMTEVKERLYASFITPMENAELRSLYRKSLSGGLLLYGPPGCGKSFIARALAGQLKAAFVNVAISDVLDMWVGKSERNLHELFELARHHAPTVLFIDELDALGRRRSSLNSDAMRTTVNQLLTEMDGVQGGNQDVYVLGATNHPWDVDVALRRPGRFDRMLLVLPPDADARAVIFRTHLKDRPIEGIDAVRLAGLTPHFSGADIAYVCELAAERAMLDSARTNNVRMINMADLEWGVGQVRPSTAAWFEAAKNVVSFANTDGSFDDLRAYMKRTRLL